MANEFESSLDATEFVFDLQNMMDDERLADWMVVTDSHYGTDFQTRLAALKFQLDRFVDDFMELDN